MSYVLIERNYDNAGVLLHSGRITGNSEDLEWIKYQMQYAFNECLHKYREFIVPGAIHINDYECSLTTNNGGIIILTIEDR